MTKINRLTQIPTLEDSDLAVVWQDSSERTRAITIANLRNFIQSTDPNSDAFVKAELIGDELVLTSHDEVETRIDINLLPEHSVTELKDMPNELIAGNYLKVSDDGTGFVLTPASEISAAILVREGGQLKGVANVLDFGNASISLENRIARINSGLLIDDQFVTKIYTERDLDVLIEDGEATISVNNRVSPWPIEEVGIGDSPKAIDSVDQLGIEYQFEASSEFSQSVHLYHVGLPEGAQIKVTVVNVEPNSKPIDVFQISSGGDLSWPVITPTVFTLRSGLWRVEESSQLLHVANATTFDDDAAIKKIVHGVALDPNSAITMDVNDDGVLVIGGGGVSDEPTFKRVNIDTNGSGQPNFTASIHQDNELHTVIDATRELRVNYKDIGTGTTTAVMGIDNNQLQSLVPMYVGNDKVATYGENTFTKKQTIQMDAIGDALKVNRLNGYPLLTVNNGLQSSSVTYTKTLEEYEEETAPYDLINRAYLAANYLPRNNPWVARDVAVFASNLYHTGSEFFSNANYFYLKTGATISTGNLAFDEETMNWTGDIVDFGRMLEDSIEFDKANIKNLTTDQIIAKGGNIVIKHTNAELNHLEIAYQGKYGESRVHYPCVMQQGSSGRVNFDFTRELKFTYKNPSSGSTDISSVLTLSQTGATYEGDTSQPKSPITREALDAEPQKEWFTVANGTLTTNGNRPTGGSGVEGELAIWHNVTADSVTDPANELKVVFDGAYEKIDEFSRPLRFRLSQQSGTRNQYWTVDDNGWQTEGNVWHLSASKVTGDNLVVGIDTKVYASAYFLEEGSGSNYQGEGLGVPEGAFLVTGTVNQSEPVALYYNGLNDGSSRGNIELNNNDGYNEFQVIIQGLAKPTRDWRIGTGTPGRYSDKTIRPGETWLCRVFVDWNASSNTNFFWTRLDDGTLNLHPRRGRIQSEVRIQPTLQRRRFNSHNHVQ